MSAEERRESIIRAGTTEFAHGGYRGTSTEGLGREDAPRSVADVYRTIIAERPDLLLTQMYAAEQAGDREFGEELRAGWTRL